MRGAGFARLLEYYDAAEDEYTILNIDHSRRPKLTLRHLGKLRRTRALDEMEKAQRRKDVFTLYGPEQRKP